MPGKRLVVVASSLQDYMRPWSTDARKPAKLVWYNLDAPPPDMVTGYAAPGMQFGEIMRQGDPRGAACPTWSHDGANVIYSSTAGGNSDGALQTGATDLYMVPFNDGNGGMAKPIDGASDPAFEEYYPAYSPNDQLVVYTRVAKGNRMYANKNAEIAVVPARGGKTIRLDANDPPACTGKKSPGINNHWAKWAPTVPEINGRRYYWLLFSSDRADIPPVPRMYPDPANTGETTVQVTQLYVTLVVEQGELTLQSYPAIYLWNQPTNTLNNTPIWEQVAIPTIE
jgi:WD40 repeat protein